mmetsp:Transcript_22704/g.26068  ORF Transcript_22704/g.26068 Transcript_22704/m.26068 type:complete len:131 (+) Transcript_22704:841-1233(+)
MKKAVVDTFSEPIEKKMFKIIKIFFSCSMNQSNEILPKPHIQRSYNLTRNKNIIVLTSTQKQPLLKLDHNFQLKSNLRGRKLILRNKRKGVKDTLDQIYTKNPELAKTKRSKLLVFGKVSRKSTLHLPSI